MAHKLQGLNILAHAPNPAPQDTTSNISNALLPDPSFAGFPDLDLWTNVAFAQDEPFVPSNDPDSDDSAKDNDLDRSSKDSSTAVVKKKRDLLAKQKTFEHHRSDSLTSTDPSPPTAAAPAPAPFDLSALLSSQFSPDAMNLNQILFANAFQPNMPFMTPFGAPPAPHPAPTPTSTSTSASTTANPHPAKKPRSRKTSSISFAARSEASASPAAGMDEDHEDGSAPTGNAEDKRRRNTQASARFRLKKKEREVAMESKCKDLESKVGELERECEALRRENGWLKGLVVGVTGGTGMPMTMPTGPGLPAPLPQQQQTGGKRKRDAAEAS